MQNTNSMRPAAIRALVYRVLDRIFAENQKATTDAKSKEEWAILREKCYHSIAAVLAFLPFVTLTWFITQLIPTSGEQYPGLVAVVLVLVIAGHGILLWNATLMLRCVLFSMRSRRTK